MDRAGHARADEEVAMSTGFQDSLESIRKLPPQRDMLIAKL